jgi:hypothetical protein
MSKLEGDVVAKEILALMGSGLPTPRLRPDTYGLAQVYLTQCLRLQRDDKRLADYHAFVGLATPLQSCLPPGASSSTSAREDDTDQGMELVPVDGDGIVAAFLILSQPREFWAPCVRGYLCTRLQACFRDVQPGEDHPRWLEQFTKRLRRLPPDSAARLSTAEFKVLAAHTRQMASQAGRDRLADMNLLLHLFSAVSSDPPLASGVQTALRKLVESGRSEFVALAFDLLQLLDDRQRYRDAVLTRLGKAFAADCQNVPPMVYSQTAAIEPRQRAQESMTRALEICQEYTAKGRDVKRQKDARWHQFAREFGEERLKQDGVQISVTNKDGVWLWHLESSLIGAASQEVIQAEIGEVTEGVFTMYRAGWDRYTLWQHKWFVPWQASVHVESHYRIEPATHEPAPGGKLTRDLAPGLPARPPAQVQFDGSLPVRASPPCRSHVKEYANRIQGLLGQGEDAAQSMGGFRSVAAQALADKFPKTRSAGERLWIAETLLALTEGTEPRARCLATLRDVAPFGVDTGFWLSTVFASAFGDYPERGVRTYFFSALDHVIGMPVELSESAASSGPPPIVSAFADRCRAFFSEKGIPPLVIRLMSNLDTDGQVLAHYRWYMISAQVLGHVCPTGDIRGRLIDELSQYDVVQNGEPRFSALHVRACFSLLLIPAQESADSANSPNTELRRVRAREAMELVKRLYHEDSLGSPGKESEDKVQRNLAIARAVLQKLQEVVK